jgi:hypothetical protein
MTKAPLHGAIWSRMGSPNYWSLRNMTPTQFYEGEKSGLSALHNFIPTSKNLTTKGKLSMGSDKVLEYTKDEPSKSLRFTTKSQVSSAMFRRMAAMLRNPVPSSNGFVPQEERGAYIEYVTWLHYLLYETSIGGVVELDKMLMQARQDGEWLKFGPIPQRFERTKWPSANPIVCAFCEAAGHPFDQCQYRESEQDIPRLALHASNFVSDSSGKAQICGPWNSTRGCSKGSNCPQQHICLLCKTSTHPAKDCRALAGAGATPPHPKPSKPISPEETKILISFLASLQENRGSEGGRERTWPRARRRARRKVKGPRGSRAQKKTRNQSQMYPLEEEHNKNRLSKQSYPRCCEPKRQVQHSLTPIEPHSLKK